MGHLARASRRSFKMNARDEVSVALQIGLRYKEIARNGCCTDRRTDCDRHLRASSTRRSRIRLRLPGLLGPVALCSLVDHSLALLRPAKAAAYPETRPKSAPGGACRSRSLRWTEGSRSAVRCPGKLAWLAATRSSALRVLYVWAAVDGERTQNLGRRHVAGTYGGNHPT
jgi:hypothetical protein